MPECLNGLLFNGEAIHMSLGGYPMLREFLSQKYVWLVTVIGHPVIQYIVSHRIVLLVKLCLVITCFRI